MAEIYGNQQPDNMRGNQTASLGTEFERSIERNMPQEAAGDRPADTTTAAREGVAALKQKAGDELGSVKQAAERGVEQATEKASEFADHQKHYIASRVSDVAEALEKAGRDMEQGESAPIGRYMSQVGSSAKTFAKRMEGRDMSQIAGMAEDFGRRQPLAFLGLAAIAGLAASRFLMASNDRTAGTTNTGAGTGMERGTASATPSTGPGYDPFVSPSSMEGNRNG